MSDSARQMLQALPSIDRLLREPQVIALEPRWGHATCVALARETIAALRQRIRAGEAAAADLNPAAVAAEIAARAEHLTGPPLRRVWNATGILIHTNLGRAPLSAAAQEAVRRVAAGYASLEMDLASGRRTSRLRHVRELLCRVTGAEDALAVNNNAAAVFLTLIALAAGRDVIVSRGELVEIGGSFRLPEIMAASGARLREVGTTNRTRREDYAAAIGAETGLILYVHPSNYVISGFTESVPLAALAELARARGVPLLADLGSGALDQHPGAFLRDEPRVQRALAAGVDLLCFSGDKLLGGPQAGILLGGREWIARLQAHPAARVVRLDKLHLTALEATLLAYLGGPRGLEQIPLYRMLARSLDELRAVGETIVDELMRSAPSGWSAAVVPTRAAAGGGALPGEEVDSIGIEVTHPTHSVDAFARSLRMGDPALVGRIEQERLVLDLRTLAEDEHLALPALLAGRMRGLEAPAEGGER